MQVIHEVIYNSKGIDNIYTFKEDGTISCKACYGNRQYLLENKGYVMATPAEAEVIEKQIIIDWLQYKNVLLNRVVRRKAL